MMALTWVARVLGTLLVLMVVAFAIGEGLPPVFRMRGTEALQMAGFGLMLAGLLAAWKWPLAGGIVTVAGFAAFQAAEVTANHRLATAWPFALFLAAGFLHILSAWSHGHPASQP